MIRKLITAFLLISLTTVTFSQDFNKMKMDSFFTILSEKSKAMGSVAISKNGQVIYRNAIGYALYNGNDKQPATINTRYRIGSITKMFTAVIIFQLIEEKKLTLDDKLSGFFPSVPNADKISIANLLSHRSGLHNFTDDSLYTTYMHQQKTHEEMLAIISASPADFEAGTKTSYSNTNYLLLGYLAEKLGKKDYSTLVRERITGKLQLNDTYVGAKTNLQERECYSYLMTRDWEQFPETEPSITAGAGSIVSSSADLVRFIEALFGGKLISAGSLEMMKTTKDGLGMGMFRIPFYNRWAFGHNGRIDGFESTVAYFPKDSVSVSYCSNGVSYPFNDILIGILSICFNKPYTIPTFEKVKYEPGNLDQYTGEYSSTQLPLKITVSKDENGLMAQATGQSAFPLEPSGKHIFRFEASGIIMEFHPDKKEFTLKQGGHSFLYTKDN